MRVNGRQPGTQACHGARAGRSGRAFTLVETLVVVSITSLLLAMLLPAISSVRSRMKALKCSSNMRTVAFKFQLFAEGNNPEGHGESERMGPARFSVNDFQESLYRIDEFWDARGETSSVLAAGKELMLCPAGPKRLTKRRGFPCGSEAIQPPEDVTLALNMRFYRAPVVFNGRPVLAPVAATHVRRDVLSHPYVPLLMDVNGHEASKRSLEPFYTAPPARLAGQDDPYADGRYWMPSARHQGRTYVAFVGGHVLSSTHADEEAWDWDYTAEVGN